MDKKDAAHLKKRYLLWLYKTTKESLDRIERKFTQLDIDRFILRELKKKASGRGVKRFVEDWAVYIRNKEKEGMGLKFKGKEINPEPQFLFLKLKAVEKAIRRNLGQQALTEIKSLYEKEMAERILKSTEHK
jgi:hypothetical protein